MTQKGIVTMVKLRPKRLRLGSAGIALVEAVARLENKALTTHKGCTCGEHKGLC